MLAAPGLNFESGLKRGVGCLFVRLVNYFMWVLKSPREAYSMSRLSGLGCGDGSRKVAYTLKYDLEESKLRKYDKCTRWMSTLISNKYVIRNDKGTQCMISRINEFWSTHALKCTEYFSVIIHFAKWVKRAFYCRSTESPRIDFGRWNAKKITAGNKAKQWCV